MQALRSLVVAVVAFVVLAVPAALVVGNSTYAHIGRLPNPDNAARDMSAALRRLGFEVTTEEAHVFLPFNDAGDATSSASASTRSASAFVFGQLDQLPQSS